MKRAIGALVAGVAMVARAPLLVALVLLVSMIGAVPFALVVGSELQRSLADQPPIDRGSGEINADWWMEFRQHAEGLEATFTPTIIGFAAPLDNVSSLLDGTRRPAALAVPVVLAGLAWAFLWGGILQRFSLRRGLSPGEFWRAGMQHFPRFAAIAAAAAVVHVVLYLTIHAALFGPVYELLAAAAGSERNAFFARVVLYLIFGALLAAVALAADYARISSLGGRAASVAGAVRTAIRFMRGHWPAVSALYLMTGALFVAMLVTYGAGEILGGSRVGGWRAIAIGQAYILGRLVLRLVFAASEVRLFEAGLEGAAQASSRTPE
jgi:hypothetical protein